MLPPNTTERELEELFGGYAGVEKLTIHASGRSAYVEILNDEEAQMAIDDLNLSEFKGETIIVEKDHNPMELSGSARYLSRGGGGR